ncbi:MAG: hypothetical protein ACLTRJ_07390 [Bifidobacterium longum]
MGRSGPERPWNWLTGTDASPDDLLLGGSRKVEEPFGRIDPDDVRPSADLPDRDPRNGLTDAWRVVPGDRLVTFEPGGLPKSWRISAVRRNAADLSLVVNDPVTGEPVEPDLMALLRDGCFDFDRSRETPKWQGFWRSERGMVAYRDASGFVRRWTPGHGLGAELVSPAKCGLWFDVPDASLAKLAGQGCRMVKPTHGKGQCKPRPWVVSSP